MAERTYPPEVWAEILHLRREIKRLTVQNRALMQRLAAIVRTATRPIRGR